MCVILGELFPLKRRQSFGSSARHNQIAISFWFHAMAMAQFTSTAPVLQVRDSVANTSRSCYGMQRCCGMERFHAMAFRRRQEPSVSIKRSQKTRAMYVDDDNEASIAFFTLPQAKANLHQFSYRLLIILILCSQRFSIGYSLLQQKPSSRTGVLCFLKFIPFPFVV